MCVCGGVGVGRGVGGLGVGVGVGVLGLGGWVGCVAGGGGGGGVGWGWGVGVAGGGWGYSLRISPVIKIESVHAFTREWGVGVGTPCLWLVGSLWPYFIQDWKKGWGAKFYIWNRGVYLLTWYMPPPPPLYLQHPPTPPPTRPPPMTSSLKCHDIHQSSWTIVTRVSFGQSAFKNYVSHNWPSNLKLTSSLAHLISQMILLGPDINTLGWGETRWPTFCSRLFQMHFPQWKCLNFD